jgi:heme/copper-type cytochrome/quinol oxidase subunit 3
MSTDLTSLDALPVGAVGERGVGWWGVLCLIATEASLFAYLLFSYFYTYVQQGRTWSPEPHPPIALAAANTLVLLASSGSAAWADRAEQRGARASAIAGLAATLLLGSVFAVVQAFEWRAKPFTLTSGGYGSLYFTITGFHMAHVLAGLVMLGIVLVWTALGYFDRKRHLPLSIGVVYWHFVDVVWLFVFASFYVLPRAW